MVVVKDLLLHKQSCSVRFLGSVSLAGLYGVEYRGSRC